MERAHRKIRRPTTRVTRFIYLNVRRRCRSITLLRHSTRTFFRATFIQFQGSRLVSRSLSAIRLVPIRLRTVGCLFRLAICPSVRVTFLSRLLRGFLVVSFAIASGQNGRVNLLPFVLIRGRFRHLLFNMFRRLLTTRVQVDLSHPYVGRARGIVGLNDHPRYKSQVLIYYFLLS